MESVDYDDMVNGCNESIEYVTIGTSSSSFGPFTFCWVKRSNGLHIVVFLLHITVNKLVEIEIAFERLPASFSQERVGEEPMTIRWAQKKKIYVLV